MPVAAPEPISARDARRIALAGQGLLGPRPAGNPAAVLRRLRAVQLDTISVLARSHQLVAYARLGPVTAQKVESAYWAGPPFGAFEYWAHAACILPMEDWPFYEFQRHARRERGHRWHKLDNTYEACKIILDRLGSDGPLTANELGGAKGWTLVGLVRYQDRRRVASRYRRSRVREAAGVSKGLRPARSSSPGRAARDHDRA